MANISDLIERYLKELFENSSKEYIEIQRNELANHFNCVPSQINYVISTRFTLDHGFVVESRRGGGGFVRIVKVPLNDCFLALDDLVGEEISQKVATNILKRLQREALITDREYKIMKVAVDRAVLKLELPWRDKLRANLLKAMLAAIITENA